MNFKYTLSKEWIDKVVEMAEFADGGTQVSMKTRDGHIYKEILISTCKWVVAMRGHHDLPFLLEDVIDIFQTEEDENPSVRGGWEPWDEYWKQMKNKIADRKNKK